MNDLHFDAVAFPAEMTPVRSTKARQQQKAARALNEFRKRREEIVAPHPYFALCVCDRCKGAR